MKIVCVSIALLALVACTKASTEDRAGAPATSTKTTASTTKAGAAPDAGSTICDRLLPMEARGTLFPHATIAARPTTLEALCAVTGDAAKGEAALIALACGESGEWTETLPKETTLYQMKDDATTCVVTVAVGAAWSSQAKLIAKTVLAAAVETHGTLVRIDLPRGASRDIDPSATSLVVSVADDGAIQVNGRAVKPSDLDDLFRAAAAKDPGAQVIIQAAPTVKHASVIDIMERAKRAGLTKLAISTSR
jgi:biopolymer transport protein ExbD